MYDATIEEYLCRIRNVVEGLQRRVKVVVVVESNCLDPCLDLLCCSDVRSEVSSKGPVTLTCFNDIAADTTFDWRQVLVESC